VRASIIGTMSSSSSSKPGAGDWSGPQSGFGARARASVGGGGGGGFAAGGVADVSARVAGAQARATRGN
jgi:hypothetical protein